MNFTRKIALIIITCSIISSANAQSWEELNQKATGYANIGDYQTAAKYAEQAKVQAESEFGKESQNYLASLLNLALYYFNMGNYPKAEPLFKESLELAKTAIGTSDPGYANIMNILGLVYKNMGQYTKAESLYIEALNIRKNILGPEHIDYAESLNNLGVLYFTLGNYAKAEPLYLESLAISKKLFGTDNPNYVKSLSNLASLYKIMGDYKKAESFYLDVLDIKKKIYGPENSDYALSLDNLAVLYKVIGNYDKAEMLWIEALNIEKKTLGTNHPTYAQTLNNIAEFYTGIGNYTKAVPFFIEVLNIRKKMLGENHPDYAQSLISLAGISKEMGEYPKAKTLYLEAINIIKSVFGTNNPTYTNSINSLADLYSEMGNYTEAESLLLQTINARKIHLGTDHPDYADALNSLAYLYDKMGNYTKAEPLFIEALNIKKKVFGQNNPLYTISLHNMAVSYTEAGNYDKAEPFYVQANANLNKQIELNFSFLSEQEKEQHLFLRADFYYDMYNSFFLKRKEQNPEITEISFNNELIHKGMLLQSATAEYKAIFSSRDNSLIKIYDQLVSTHKKLSEQYSLPINKRKINTDSLENIANTLEKELISKEKNIPGFKNLARLSKITWKDVQQILKPGEAAIEFIKFRYYNKKWTDSTFYCALVLRKDDNYPKMIYLFEERQLQNVISTPQASGSENYITQLYSFKSDLSSNRLSSGNILYQLIWQPIDSALNEIKTVYISPGGLLNMIAFSAIPVKDSVYLSDKYDMNILSSTRVLTQFNKAKQPSKNNFSAVLYGGIQYDVDSTEMLINSKQYQKPNQYRYTTRSINIPEKDRGSVWKYLPGTLSEVTDIQKLFDIKQISAQLYKEKQATEESFKHLTDNGKSPEMIHIATHGFFFPEIKSKPEEIGKVIFRSTNNMDMMNAPVFTYSENPLLRSGILFAGANRVWKQQPPIEGVEDGTLTAYEVSNMNLSNTQIVILSACETGLGEVKGSEGVFGLQRAFKMAGVRYIIMSLWVIPDMQTSELMKLFYNNWLNGMNVKNAFNTAQGTMRKKYPPYYWAAFVLIE